MLTNTLQLDIRQYPDQISEKLLLLNRHAGWSERLDVARLKLVAEVEQLGGIM